MKENEKEARFRYSPCSFQTKQINRTVKSPAWVCSHTQKSPQHLKQPYSGGLCSESYLWILWWKWRIINTATCCVVSVKVEVFQVCGIYYSWPCWCHRPGERWLSAVRSESRCNNKRHINNALKFLNFVNQCHIETSSGQIHSKCWWNWWN